MKALALLLLCATARADYALVTSDLAKFEPKPALQGGDPAALDPLILPQLFPIALPHPALAGLASKAGEIVLGICDSKAESIQVLEAVKKHTPQAAIELRSFAFSGSSPGLCPEFMSEARIATREKYVAIATLPTEGALKWKVEKNQPPKKPALPRRVRMSLYKGSKRIAQLALRGLARQGYQSDALGEHLGEWADWEYFESVKLGNQTLLLAGVTSYGEDHGGTDCHLFGYACGKITAVIPNAQRFSGLPEKPFRCGPLAGQIKVLSPGAPWPAKISIAGVERSWDAQACEYR